jgi:GNAT superfamily N-acetyltransferase
MSPAFASSIALRVRASASPSNNSSIARVVALRVPLGRPLGLPGGTLLVAESDGQCVGMSACVVFPFYANMQTKIGQEIFLFCKPEFRNGIGQALLDELEAEARRKGANVFISANLAGDRDKAFSRFYRRRGYAPSENTHIRVFA